MGRHVTLFRSLAAPALADLRQSLSARHEAFKARGLKLDMTRGKPSAEQLDLCSELFGRIDNFVASDGSDTRNYGGLDGLPEMKAIFAELLEVPAAQVIVGGNSSLQLMHDAIVRAVLHGVPGGARPWGAAPSKFLCPVPGYDRHFSILEHFGIEMINVEMDDGGPKLDVVEDLVAQDPAIKGMWCVPKYSNPNGITCSDQAVERLSRMKTAAPDFRLFWDNAYAVHDLYSESDRLANVFEACARAGNPDRPLLFASTSKISAAGAGVAAFAASPANVADAKAHLFFQTIGPDKVNQLRHARYFSSFAGIRAHMKKHAAILRPKFERVTDIFERELDGKGVATWTKPRGGYFISLDTSVASAREVIRLANEAGVKLTQAGATFPYGKDPRDSNIRIAPTLPPLDQIQTAMEVVAVCVQLASVNALQT
jgi:DNA-binding transcriptional MocR family regulator